MTDFQCDIKKLSELLKPEDEDEDSEDDITCPGYSKLGPGDIGGKKCATVGSSNFKVKTSLGEGSFDADIEKSQCDDIWQDHEITEASSGDADRIDPRENPVYDIKYQQAVSAEDVFLQMGGKTGATASCENMVVTVYLEGESKKAVDLTVAKTSLEIRSPLYRLHLHLPHSVDPECGRAEWDQKQQALKVILRMVREYDFLNF